MRNLEGAAYSETLARLGTELATDHSMSNATTTTDALKARRALYLAKLLGALPKAPRPEIVRPSSDRRIR